MSFKYLPFYLFLFLSNIAAAQIDTEFWFAAPEVGINQATFDRPIKFYITTYGQAATVNISQPAGGGMPTQTVTVPANNTTSVDVTNWISVIEAQPANTVLNYGIKIASTAPITVYYEVVSAQCQCNPEFFSLKGRNALGTDFYISSQNTANNNPNYPTAPYSSFDIIATQNNTSVTITPTNNVVGHTAGVPYTITLNTGQVYSATATSQMASQHLEGSRVTSNKPIAITLRDDLLTGPWGGCADLAGDQTVPVSALGKEYIAVDGGLFAPNDHLFILATQNNTTVSVNGTLHTTINAGATYQVAIGGPHAYIQTSQPAYVLQLSGIGCELGSAILPKLECSGSTSVSFARSTSQTLTITLVVKNGGQGNFLVNGNTGVVTAGMFSVVPGTGGQYYAAKVTLPVAQYAQGAIVAVSNTSHLFHLGVLDGGSNSGARFGYFSNFNLASTSSWVDKPICQGDTIKLHTFPIAGASYAWVGPNSFSSTAQNPKIPNAALAASGKYALQVSVAGCISRDTVEVNITPKPLTIITSPTKFCEHDTMHLTANSVAGATYSWTGPGGFTSTLQMASIPNALAAQSGKYILRIATGDCVNGDTADIKVNKLPTVKMAPKPAVICKDGELGFKATGAKTYTWSPSTGISATTGDTVTVTQTSVVKYVLTGVDTNQCVNKDSVNLTVASLPAITVTPEQQTICPPAVATLTASGGLTYSWSPAAGLSSTSGPTVSASPGASTSYVVKGTDSRGCSGQATAFITVGDTMSTNLNINICPDSVYQFGGLKLKDSGTYKQPFKSIHGCDSVVTLQLSYSQAPKADFVHYPIMPERNKPIKFTNQSISATSYLWDFGNGKNSEEVNPEHQYVRSGDYKVCLTAFSNLGCKDIICRTAKADVLPLIDVPTAFSPNGDGKNDILELLGGAVAKVSFRVYNRWGLLVFESTSMTKGWDGTYNGKMLDTETFAYVLQAEFIDGTTYSKKGNITLIH